MLPAEHREAGLLPHPDDLRAYVDYLRDLGVYDLLAQHTGNVPDDTIAAWAESNLRPQASRPTPTAKPSGTGAQQSSAVNEARSASSEHAAASSVGRLPALTPFDQAQQRRTAVSAAPRPHAAPAIQISPPSLNPQSGVSPAAPGIEAPHMPAPTPFNQLAPLPTERVAPAQKPAALETLRKHIGDCTRCPLAYAGRHSIVFADGDPNARLMFVGEGPGADEDSQGLPFVGKAGQLLNNMIAAMGLQREEVYIANIVKCRPPKNRVPEPVEANTCSPFLLQQIDTVHPEMIIALGGTAATYLLGVKQSLTSLRGRWFDVRGARCVVTYHPAFLLRDPRQKGEAWKDLQRVMAELKLKPPART